MFAPGVRFFWFLFTYLRALRKGLGFGYRFGRPGLGSTEYITDATAWHVPFLVQYGRTFGSVTRMSAADRFSAGSVGERRRARIVRNCPSVVCTPFAQSQLSDFGDKTTTGIAMGAGVEIAAAFARLSPEVRSTKWMGQPFTAAVANDNQVQSLSRVAVPIGRF